MISTTFLAQFFGILSLVMGGIGLYRNSLIQEWLTKAIMRPSAFFLVGAFEFIAGLLIVLGHQVWSTFPAALITIIGWLLILESLFYLVAPRGSLVHLLARIDRRDVIIATSVIWLGVGVVLSLFGFGLL